ncbi:MAG: SDR family oxidoreductase, partial [Dehalococcoidia bacterium]|nr:SDR family oxidoreductase [Dehalococcoidia bacterium]
IPLKVDVTSEEDIKNMVRRADEAFGRIDVIVNNAGVPMLTPAVKVELEEWNNVINVNLTGVFLCAREAAKYMMGKGIKGSIINIASGYGELADTAPCSAYYASKAGVINLTRGLANEWGHFGIRVNSLCPGWFPTEMTQPFFENKEWVRHMSSKIALGRLGKLDDMKPLVIFMASDASEYISGHAFEMLGGPAATAETIDTGIKYLKDFLGEEYLKPFKFMP